MNEHFWIGFEKQAAFSVGGVINTAKGIGQKILGAGKNIVSGAKNVMQGTGANMANMGRNMANTPGTGYMKKALGNTLQAGGRFAVQHPGAAAGVAGGVGVTGIWGANKMLGSNNNTTQVQ